MTIRKSLFLIACWLVSTSAFSQTTGTSTPNDPTSMPEPRMMQMDKDGDGMIDSAEYSAAGIGGNSSKPVKN